MKKGTERINDRTWKQYLSEKNKFELFGANPEVAKKSNLKNKTTRRILLSFEHQNDKYPNIMDYFRITSGTEVSIPKEIKDVIKEYKNDYPESYLIFEILDLLDVETDGEILQKKEINTETIASIKIRKLQQKFREELLKKHKNCQVTQLSEKSLLVASHIKRWDSSSNVERIDINNGLLLNVAIDKLFDKGYITFDSNGKIIISKRCDFQIKNIFNIHDDIKIPIFKGQEKYLEWHRANVFDRT